jgi:hypothetical protein
MKIEGHVQEIDLKLKKKSILDFCENDKINPPKCALAWFENGLIEM